ncbi:MAG TPA: amino acid adenylation domain-containing protein, partial [Thermoanaerobaculia bacterium]|nr:amino acid adenylation domain-containing protein [Thermoanaerobaculia bacterium]
TPLADGLVAEVVPVETGIAKLDLTLALGEKVGPSGGTLAGFLEFNRDLFDPATAVRLAESLAVLLDAAAEDPGCRVGELPLLAAGARHQLLVEWNERSSPASAAPEIGFHELFFRQAAERPEAIALVDEREAVSFDDLARRARRIAAGLARLGVRPEVRVGLCAGRSAAAVAGVLGILAAGGVYVPLDPAYPAERLALLIGDAGVELILGEGDQLPLLAALLETHPGVRTVALEEVEEVMEEEFDTLGQRAGAPDCLAYVIYTSGSTGTPKGVGVTHRTAVNLGLGFHQVLWLGPADRVLQFAPWSFDASIAELAVAWAAGAALHLAGRESLLPGEPLARLLGERGITTVTLPPSALAALPPGHYPDLTLLAVAGEACPAELAERWMPGGMPGRRFVNAYGPTETTVCASAGRQWPGAGPLTLGRPLPGLRVYLLDVGSQERQGRQGLQPVPLGVLGEIYVGGGLARGYLGRPAATAERFVPDPFASEPGARLYRTGDLGRALANGEVVFAGRADRQVKVRGFRVEPGEIEEALAGHPAVRETAVMVEQVRPGDLRLVAYAAGPGLAAAGAGALRDHLRRRLPEHMVPARFVLLDALPLTPSGKVDRGALALLRGEAVPGREPAPPQTEVEQMLAEMWSEVLGLDRGAAALGIHDDFFDLGGHSLNATQVLRRIKETLGVEVPVRRFFAAPTIAELAVAVAEELMAGVGESEQSEILAGLS